MGSTVIVRSDLQSNWPFVLVLSIPWTLCIFVVFTKPSGASFLPVLPYFPLFLYWLRSYRIIFLADQLNYSVGAFPKGSARYEEIKSVVYQKAVDQRRPIFSFYVDAGAKSFVINAKPFSKARIAEVSRLLAKNLGPNKISPEIAEFAKEDFRSLGLTWQQRSQLLSRLAWIVFLSALFKALMHSGTQ